MKYSIVKVTGGLGNQLFQYAFGNYLREKYQIKVYYDLFQYIVNNTRPCVFDSLGLNYNRINILHEFYYYFVNKYLKKDFHKHNIKNESADDEFFKLMNENMVYKYYNGCWQNESYIDFNKIVFNNEKEILEKIRNIQNSLFLNIKNSNSVAIHVRRGDYKAINHFTIIGFEYYKKAIEYIKKEISNPVFYCFSDDINEAKSLLNHFDNIYYIDNNLGLDDVCQFILLKQFKHYIIANSTFSWWASKLSNNIDKILIAPRNWYVKEKDSRDCQNALLSKFVLF